MLMLNRMVKLRIGREWNDLPADFLESEAGRAGGELIASLRGRVQKLAEDAVLVRRDPELSDVGRERRLRGMATEARLNKRIAELKTQWRFTRQQREGFLKQQIRDAAAIDPPNNPREISLDAEIRAHLKRLDRESRSSFLDRALEENDLRAIRAVLTAPAFLSGFSEVDQERLQERAGFNRTTAEPAELQMLRRATNLILLAERSFERIVQELTGDVGRRASTSLLEERRYTADRRHARRRGESRLIDARWTLDPRLRWQARTH